MAENKFEYRYSVGDTVYAPNGTRLTIKRRCGNFDTPHYWVEQNGLIYDETQLLSENPNAPTKEELDREEYARELRRLNNENEFLSKYSRNLNLLALNGELTMTYGREKEVTEISTILLRRTKPNPLLIGVAGCGKTAIVEELARQLVNERLATGNPHTPVIYDLSLNSLVSGARYRGDFEERLQAVMETVKKNKDIIVFIDEIHSLNSIGNAEGAISAGQILKPSLARGEIRCIGATTIDEYKEYIATDKALTRRFSVVNVSPISGTARENCITNILSEYGRYFGIDTAKVKTETLLTIIDDCIPHTIFPDNVIDIIDETLATAKANKKAEVNDDDMKRTASRQHNIIII